MDADMQAHACAAIARLDHVLEQSGDIEHSDVQIAVNAVIAFRNRAIENHCRGAVSHRCLDKANALVSLAYGAEFPLSGLHRRRFEQTRTGLNELLRGG